MDPMIATEYATPKQPAKARMPIFSIVACLCALLFAALWIRQLAGGGAPAPKAPQQKFLIEKPVEKPEVPAALTEKQQELIAYGVLYLNSPRVTSEKELLYNIPAFSVNVSVAQNLKEQVSEERLRTKLELLLRKNRIKIDPESPVQLSLVLQCLWNTEKTFCTWRCNLKVLDTATLMRDGDFRKAYFTTYEQGHFGYAGKTRVEEAILETVDEEGEAFANDYLAQQEQDEARQKALKDGADEPNRALMNRASGK